MRRRYLKYFLPFTFFPVLCYGQSNDSVHNSILKLNLLSLVDIHTFPTVQLAYERNLSNNFSLEAETGYQLYSFYKGDTSFIRPSGLKANLELRYYFPNRQLDKTEVAVLTGWYGAINVFYRQSRSNQVLLYYYPNDTTEREDYFYATKTIFGFNFLLGYQFNASKYVAIDLYAGLGLMKRTAKDHNREYNATRDTLNTAIDFNLPQTITDSYLSENNGNLNNVTLGVRVGIRL